MKILLVDGTNIFIRCWVVVPTLNSNGESNGGVSGFLKSLVHAIDLSQPDKVIVVWDGAGGSQKRRDIDEHYKDGRKPIRLNRNYDFELENVDQNKIRQRLRLSEYLNELPMSQVIVENIEADDVISYLVKFYEQENKTIFSSDKDFYQLINDKTNIYSPTKKQFIDENFVLSCYNVHPNNFCLFRSIIGDKSDNLKGIYGIGEKKATKLFDCLSQKNPITLEQFFKICEENTEKYKRILDQKDIIIKNYKLMQLADPIIGLSSIQKIKAAISKPTQFSATNIRIKFLEDGIDSFSTYFFQSFKILNLRGKL